MVQIFFGYIVLVFISLCNCEDLPEIITAPQATSDVTGTENFGKKIGDDVVNFVDEIIPYSTEANGSEARHLCNKKKKKKFKKKAMKVLMTLAIIWLVIKALLLPIVLKGLLILSGKAFLLSLLSIILAAIMGIQRLVTVIGGFPGLPFSNFGGGGDTFSKYRRKEDEIIDEGPTYEGSEPYKYYRNRDLNKDLN